MVDETFAHVSEGKGSQTIQQVLSKYKVLLDCDRVHFAPAIPEKKLRNAIAAYAPDVSPESVLVLVDDTTFHGAREGMLLTGTHVYSHPTGKDPICRCLSEISSIEHKKRWTSVQISAGGKPLGELVLLDKYFLTLIEMLQEMSKVPAGLSCVTQEKAAEYPSQGPGESKVKPTPPKKTYTKKWFIPLGKLNVYVLGPLSLAMAGLALYLDNPLSGVMTIACILLLMGAAFAFGLGTTAMKGKALAFDDMIIGLWYAPFTLVCCGVFWILPVAIPWFGRHTLLRKATSADANVRRKVADGFGQILAYSNLTDARMTSALVALATDSDTEVRREAIEALGWTSDAGVIETLGNATGDAAADVRLEAVWSLGRIKDQRARFILSDLVRSDPSPEVRKKAQWALGRLPGTTERSEPSPSGTPGPVAQSDSPRSKTGAEIGYVLGMISGTIFGIVFCWKIHPVLGIITLIVAIVKVLPLILSMLGS